MQRIERYGVIALVFLLVTILAVSLWGDKKSDKLWSFLKKADEETLPGEIATATAPRGAPARDRGAARNALPLSPPPEGAATQRRPPPSIGPAALDQRSLASLRGGAAPEELGANETLLPPPLSAAAPPRSEPTAEPPGQRPIGQPSQKPTREYVVRAGETLGEIAQRELGTWRRWTEIQAANGGLDPTKLRAGMTIRLPATGASAAQPAAAPSVAAAVAAEQKPQAPRVQTPPSSARTVAVRPGETLSTIASRELGSASRWRDIADLNPGIDPDRLLVGTVLRLPGGAAASPSPAVAPAPVQGGLTHTVAPGDTLGAIAARTLGSSARWREIAELNPGVDPGRLIVGQKLHLPSGATASRSEPAPERVASADRPAAKKARVR